MHRGSLIHVLRSAYSGELAAGYAYRGHAASVRAPAIRERILQIEAEEWHHRELVGKMLAELGAKPSAIREAVFWIIGHVVGGLCHIGGWFIPMYGAGRLELWNIREYETAAGFARNAELNNYIPSLLTMAGVEWTPISPVSRSIGCRFPKTAPTLRSTTPSVPNERTSDPLFASSSTRR